MSSNISRFKRSVASVVFCLVGISTALAGQGVAMAKHNAAVAAPGIVTWSDAKAGRGWEAQGNGEGRWHGFCDGWRLGENMTPAVWAANPDRGRLMMQRLVNCVFHRFAPGQVAMAFYVAYRESHYFPWASNGGHYLGIFQHCSGCWSARARDHLWRGWFARYLWPISAFDPRANAIVTARMVAEGGWGPWSL